MMQFLNQTFEVDAFTLVVVALLSGWSGILTVQVLSATLAMLFVPGFILGALVANYLFEQLRHPPDPSILRLMWSLPACCGIIVPCSSCWSGSAIAGLRVARHQFKRT